MKPFVSFYDPKGMDQPLDAKKVDELEDKIIKDVETALKQVRFSKSLTTKVRKEKKEEFMQKTLRLYLDFIEDKACSRYLSLDDEKNAYENIKLELQKLVPENNRIAIQPAYFNYTDSEKIMTIISEESKDFFLNTSKTKKNNNNKKVQFAITAKIYPFHNKINSVRLAIARITPS